MSARKLSDDNLLEQLMRLVLRNWGAKSVVLILSRLLSERDRKRYLKDEAQSDVGLTPPELVNGLKMDRKRKSVIYDLATMFESRKFMPANADVRNFLKRRGVDPSSGKSRSQQFRLLLPLLADMSEDTLLRLREQGSRSGLADLGPISDAIREFGSGRPPAIYEQAESKG